MIKGRGHREELLLQEPNTMPIADMTPEAIEEAIKTGQLTIAVIGAGRIGLPVAVLFANTGAKVIICDVDPEVVACISNCENYIDEPGLDELFEKVVKNGNLRATQDTPWGVSKADVAILSVPTPVTEAKVPIYEYILSAAKAVGKGLQRGSLVIVESTISPGTLENEILPILEQSSGFKAGKDFLVASCPERADPGSIITKFRSIPRVVGGLTKKAAKIAAAIYRPLADQIVTVSDPKTANAVKLTENIFRDVNIALMSELAILYERLGIDIFEVIEAASSKWNFIPHYPGAGVGGPCLPSNAYYVIGEGLKVGYVPYLVRMSREINDRMPREILRLVMEALNHAGKPLKDSTIAIFGVTYKPRVQDTQMSPALPIIAALKRRRARVTICDPLLDGTSVEGILATANPLEAAKQADCIVLITAHKQFEEINLESVAKIANKPLVIVDGRAFFRKMKKPKDTIYMGIGLPKEHLYDRLAK
jgi:nucleotide sugar dehydrogenase